MRKDEVVAMVPVLSGSGSESGSGSPSGVESESDRQVAEPAIGTTSEGPGGTGSLSGRAVRATGSGAPRRVLLKLSLASGGTLFAERVVLATGSLNHPVIPAWLQVEDGEDQAVPP